MAGKHDPIELRKYVRIHDRAMRVLERDGYVLPGGDGLSLDGVQNGFLMKGTIRCVGGLVIDVVKFLRVLGGEGADTLVQTTSFTYHVMIEGLGNVMRYCSPHHVENLDHPDHKPFHHKHIYDMLRGDVQGRVEPVDAETRPTLGDVIKEAGDWYYANHDAIEGARRK